MKHNNKSISNDTKQHHRKTHHHQVIRNKLILKTHLLTLYQTICHAPILYCTKPTYQKRTVGFVLHHSLGNVSLASQKLTSKNFNLSHTKYYTQQQARNLRVT